MNGTYNRVGNSDGNQSKFSHLGTLLSSAYKVFGVILMSVLAHKWSNYLQELHENEMWFSNIKEVEREISFRTEQGLYYSYFKHLTNAPTLWQGMQDLQRDNLTEHLNTINVFSRFNIHQELFLAAVYHLLGFQMAPILFYVEFVFSLQGFYMCAKFVIAWVLSGTWVAGVLALVFMVNHRGELTRVESSVPLREHWSLPFVFAQFVVVGNYLNKKSQVTGTYSDAFHLTQIHLMSFLFLLTWQFGPFVLLLQSVVLFYLAIVSILNRDMVCKILATNLFALLCVWYVQFYQSMIFYSLFTCLVPTAIIVLQSQNEHSMSKSNDGIFKKFLTSIFMLLLGIISAIMANFILKYSMGQSDDNHIFAFLKNKFGQTDVTNFETQLYLCLDSFQPLTSHFYSSLTFYSMAFPLYVMFVTFQAVCIALTVFNKWSAYSIDVSNRHLIADGNTTLSHGVDSGKNSLRRRKVKRADGGLDSKQRTSMSLSASSKNCSVSFMETFFAYIESSPNIRFMLHMDERPVHCFHVAQSLIFGSLAASVSRMKCFWTPYICILAACAIANFDFWSLIVCKLQDCIRVAANSSRTKKCGIDNSRTDAKLTYFIRFIVVMFVAIIMARSRMDDVYSELEDLREFYDPDTVDLMEWIVRETPKTAAFTGSMQLMAGVRLCTWRPVTNHPHFEDKALRDRTKELYQIYAKVGPDEVYHNLVKYNTSYIILEDSICLPPSYRVGLNRCGTPAIMDLTMGYVPDDGEKDLPHLVPSPHNRFCDEIRYNNPSYSKYFQNVFENRTFRVYKVMSPK